VPSILDPRSSILDLRSSVGAGIGVVVSIAVEVLAAISITVDVGVVVGVKVGVSVGVGIVTLPFLTVTWSSVRAPVAATWKTRKAGVVAAVLRSTIAPAPLMIMSLVTEGRPLLPSMTLWMAVRV
jgi:hypothetical protein